LGLELFDYGDFGGVFGENLAGGKPEFLHICAYMQPYAKGLGRGFLG
jgi:hypothetical protein